MIQVISNLLARIRSTTKESSSFTIEIDNIGFITTNKSLVTDNDPKLGFVRYDFSEIELFELDDEDEDVNREIKNVHSLCKSKFYDNIIKYMDFKIGVFDGNLLIGSELRGVNVIIKNFVFLLKEHRYDAVERVCKIASMFAESDKNYDIESEKHVDGTMYINLFKKSYERYTQTILKNASLSNKKEIKALAKKDCKFKYYIGDSYSLMHIDKKTGKMSESEYEVRKVIYTIGQNIVNIVIMKHISGHASNTRCVNMLDCKFFHIKYEPGLFVFPINTRFNKKSVVIN